MKKHFLATTLVIFLAFCAANAYGGTIYVSKTGHDDTGDGSAGNPYLTIQKGYNSASGDGSDVVRVSPGTYGENLVIFWGFPVTIASEDPDDPDVVAATIIDGGGRVGSVVRFQGFNDFTTITGFTVQNGHATLGSAFRIAYSHAIITKNVIKNNIGYEDEGMSQGAGIFLESCTSPVVSHNTITNNSSAYGGGVMVISCTGATISDNVISNNTGAVYAGGMWVSYSTVAVDGNVIADNECKTYFGGGIMFYMNASTPSTVTNNRFLRNKSVRSGGAIYVEDYRVSDISGNTFEANTNAQGEASAVQILRGSEVNFKNDLFTGNHGSTNEVYGGALSTNMTTFIVIENCTFSGNSLQNWASSGPCIYNGSVTIKNSIFRGNASGSGYQVFLQGNSIVNISYCDIEGGEAGVYQLGAPGSVYTWGNGNFDSDALFAAPGHLELSGTPDDPSDDVWVSGDYHLKSVEGRWNPTASGGAGAWVADAVQSPCIDAGDLATEWAYEPEPNGGCVNVGAYGGTVFASKSRGCDVTFALSPPGAGTTSPAEGTYRLTANLGKPISANPEAPFVFDRWVASPPENATIGDPYAAATGMTPTGDVTITAMIAANVAAPVILPAGGSYQTKRTVSMSCSTFGAEIHYTTNGTTPTAASTTYTAPFDVSATKTIKALAIRSGWPDSPTVSVTYRIDNSGPAASGIGNIPTAIRQGRDLAMTLTATANDAASGGCNIAEAEYFVGDDLGVGNGTPMDAADGSFDSPSEALTATVDVSAWTIASYEFHVRAKDDAGNWGSAATKSIDVVDGTAPGAVTNLAATAAGSLELLANTIDSVSSEGAGAGAAALLDVNTQTYWQTAGSDAAETQAVTFDLGESRTVEAMLCVPGPSYALFPTDLSIELSDDGVAWTKAVSVKSLKVTKAAYLWQWEPVDARYVRISGAGMLNISDGRYYWQMAEATLYKAGGALVELAWTAPGDDGYSGSAATGYDIRYSTSPITAANFDAAAAVTDVDAPKAPGSAEQAFVRLDVQAGRVYFALKTSDAVSNWADISNVAAADAYTTGFAAASPDDETVIAADALPPSFAFTQDPTASSVYINLSSSNDFVSAPTLRADGQTDSSLKFALKTGASTWTPTDAQWNSLKKLVCRDQALSWRLEGILEGYMGAFGAPRKLLFESGDIGVLPVDGAHDAAGEEAVWPDPVVPPAFEWLDATTGMEYFYINVSIYEDVPPSKKSVMPGGDFGGVRSAVKPATPAVKTIVIGGKGISTQPYSLTKAEWKNVRKLAGQGGGTIYWRVLAKDADKALTIASDARKLVIDDGDWTMTDLDLSAAAPSVEWTHSGPGIVKYNLQFSTDPQFPADKKMTVKIPSAPKAVTNYIFKPAEVTKLKKLAAKNGVSTLYYRVCGVDAEKAFTANGEPKIVNVPPLP